MKAFRDPPIIFSIILVLLVFILASYPIISFYLSSYISKPKEFEQGGYVAYLGEEIIFGRKFGPLAFFYLLNISRTDKGYLLSLSVFNYTDVVEQVMRYGGLGFPPSLIPRIDFSKLTPSCTTVLAVTNASRSSLLRVIILADRNGARSIRLEGGGVLEAYINGSSSFVATPSSRTPDFFLGYARIYETRNITINTTLADLRGEVSLLYIKTGSSYILGSAIFRYGALAALTRHNFNYTHFVIDSLYRDFGASCPYLARVMKLVKSRGSNVHNEFLFLYSLSFVPSDQAWWDAFIARFNALFPFNYVLLGLSALLIIARMRKWL